MKKGRVLVLPVFQERENILKVLKPLEDYFERFIIVSDGPDDGTFSLLEENGFFSRPGFLFIDGPGKGLGKAILCGLSKALENSFEILMYMDSDLSHRPEDAKKLLHAITSADDFLIGSRYVKGGKIEDWSMYRLFLSGSANMAAKLFKKLPYNDCTSGFRVLRMPAVKEICSKSSYQNGYIFQVEALRKLHLAGFKGREVPITFPDRIKGKSKLSFSDMIEAVNWLLFSREQRDDETQSSFNSN